MNGNLSIKPKRIFEKENGVLYGLGALLLFLLITSIVFSSKSTFSVFPAEDLGNRIGALTDRIWNGNSKIEEFAYDKNRIVLKYILKEGTPAPMVFVTINLGTAEKPVDLSHFDAVSIKIKKATHKRIMLFIKTHVPGISLPEPQKAYTLRHNQYILQLVPGSHRYTIKLKDFITPPWWLDNMKVNPALLPKESYKKVMTFDLQFNPEGSDYKINQHESVVIEEIKFHRAPSALNITLLILVLLGSAGMGVFLWRKNVTKIKAKLPKQKPLKIPSHREKELLRIKSFLEANYNVANVSTQMAAEKLGIPSSRVYELIKEEYQLTFKQLINKMRIDEAKRLLKETDLRITEIALNLGFNNVSYFNNLFKTHEGETPSELREKEKKLK